MGFTRKKPEGRTRTPRTPREPKESRVIQSSMELEPTGCTLIDLAIGGGLPWGKPINIVGDRSAGKTILTCEIMAKLFSKYKTKLQHEYDDAENGFSIPTDQMYNMHLRNQDDYRSNTVEDLESRINMRVKELESDEKLAYIVDTVEGLQSDEELNNIEAARKAREKGEPAPGSYGMAKAKHFNQMLRSKNLGDPRTMTIFVSQTRDKIGVSFGSVKTRHCEKALEYWSNLIVYLRVAREITKTIDKKEYPTGAVIECMIKKNKLVGRKFKPLIILRDGLGIDDVDTNLCFLYDLIDGYNAVKEQLKSKEKPKKGEKPKGIEFNGQEFKSRTKLIEYIEENNLEGELIRLTTIKWREIEEKLSPANRKKRY